SAKQEVQSVDSEEDSFLHDQYTIYEINSQNQDTQKYFVQVKINNIIQQFEVDSGGRWDR
ncbi:hypothetical protein, partial [Klebsiella pneumoniae]|uniref:hypothetical protein n=1 Tax=Klebsiella pneumoniae TaxID=573 RepID=UPI00405540D0